MKSVALAWVALAGFAVARGAGPAPHPTVLMAMVEGERRPVIKVVGTDPVVIVNGREKRVRTNVELFGERAPYFHAGLTIQIRNAKLQGQSIRAVRNASDVPTEGSARLSEMSYFDAQMEPSATLRGGFVVVIVFDRDFLEGAVRAPSASILAHDLPDLPAGVATQVSFTATMSTHHRGAWLVLIFASGGAEIRSDASREAAAYFRRLELGQFGPVLDAYRTRFADADRAPAPFLRIPPDLPSGMVTPERPLVADLAIAPDGTVNEVSVDGTSDAALRQVVSEALGGWLFLPRLRAGVPMASHVQVPITFPAKTK